MTSIVFVGPSLPRAEVDGRFPVRCLPPAAQGDLLRAAAELPPAIGIIDGYFDGAASVWHKEILWALKQGIHVFGSASMGALRAAELHSFGMRGVGGIFEAFRDAALEDDDEVAVLHGPPETGYVALTESMVGLRATLESASREAVVTQAAASSLIELGKSLFYQDRTWERLMAVAAARGLPAGELEALSAWLPNGRCDPKREDALQMLCEMERFLAGDPPPPSAAFDFAHTDMWAAAFEEDWPGESPGVDDLDAWILDEARLDPAEFAALRGAALARLLMLEEAERRGLGETEQEATQALNEWRLSQNLTRQSALEPWLRANDLDKRGLRRLFEREARVAALEQAEPQGLREALLDLLRLEGRYAALSERARGKRAALESRALRDPGPQEVGLNALQLAAWYFEARLRQPLPDDLPAFAGALGLKDSEALYRLLSREWIYSQSGEG